MTVKEVAELIKYTKFLDYDSHCYRVMNITSEKTKKSCEIAVYDIDCFKEWSKKEVVCIKEVKKWQYYTSGVKIYIIVK